MPSSTHEFTLFPPHEISRHYKNVQCPIGPRQVHCFELTKVVVPITETNKELRSVVGVWLGPVILSDCPSAKHGVSIISTGSVTGFSNNILPDCMQLYP